MAFLLWIFLSLRVCYITFGSGSTKSKKKEIFFLLKKNLLQVYGAFACIGAFPIIIGNHI